MPFDPSNGFYNRLQKKTFYKRAEKDWRAVKTKTEKSLLQTAVLDWRKK